MANPQQRIPEIGERVSVIGEPGEFLVTSVDSNAEAVELKQIGNDLALSTIAWDSLTIL